MNWLLELPTELILKEILRHTTPLDEQFLGSTCTSLRAATKRCFILDERNTERSLRWVVQTGKEDWIVRFLADPELRGKRPYCEVITYVLAMFLPEANIIKIQHIIKRVMDDVLLYRVHSNHNIYDGLFRAYNELCDDAKMETALALDAGFRSHVRGADGTQEKWALEGGGLFQVIMRDDFLTKVSNTSDAFCGDYFVKEPLRRLREAWGCLQKYADPYCTEFHRRFDRWCEWYVALGSPFAKVLRHFEYIHFPNLRTHLKFIEFSDGKWTLKPHILFGTYLRCAILHDSVTEVEYILQHSPIAITHELVAQIVVERVHVYPCDSSCIVRWCLDRHLFTINDFSPTAQAILARRSQWQALMKEYPWFQPQ
jgi:hypothetical protein